MQITTIGLDIVKNVFQVNAEQVVVRKQLRHSQVMQFFQELALSGRSKAMDQGQEPGGAARGGRGSGAADAELRRTIGRTRDLLRYRVVGSSHASAPTAV